MFLFIDIFWFINYKFILVDLFIMPKTAMQEGKWDKVRDTHTYENKYTDTLWLKADQNFCISEKSSIPSLCINWIISYSFIS